SSSSHALVGGLIGAGVAHAGVGGIQWTGLNKTLLAIVLSPTLGMILAMLVMLASSWGLRRATAYQAERSFRVLHLFSSAAYSLAGSIVLFGASAIGVPVSTTHTITGAIIGAGTARRASAVRWGVARGVVIAWIITIPASALMGAAFYAATLPF